MIDNGLWGWLAAIDAYFPLVMTLFAGWFVAFEIYPKSADKNDCLTMRYLVEGGHQIVAKWHLDGSLSVMWEKGDDIL